MGEAFCEGLPKVELHAHLNGSLSVETLKELRQYNIENGESQIDDKTWPEWKGIIPVAESCTLEECFKAFDIVYSVTKTPKAVNIATERVIQEFARDNVVYLELRSTLRQEDNMTKREYIESMIQAVLDSRKIRPTIIVKLIISINRRQSVESAEENVKLAVEYSKIHPSIVVGVDLSGDPTKNNFQDFQSVLSHARQEGLKLTLHCGEVVNNKEICDILHFRPDRLGHGTCIHESFQGDPDNWSRLLRSSIPVEVCVTSNLKSKTVPSADRHHFQFLFKDKHPVTLATDDKGVFGTTLSQEYLLISKVFNLTEEELWNISYQSIDYSFADDEEKVKLKQLLTLWRQKTIFK